MRVAVLVDDFEFAVRVLVEEPLRGIIPACAGSTRDWRSLDR